MDNKQPVPIKEYFTVRIEATAPIILTYKVFAESPEQAVELARKLTGQQLTAPPNIIWPALRRIRATVYNLGTSLVRLTKTL